MYSVDASVPTIGAIVLPRTGLTQPAANAVPLPAAVPTHNPRDCAAHLVPVAIADRHGAIELSGPGRTGHSVESFAVEDRQMRGLPFVPLTSSDGRRRTI